MTYFNRLITIISLLCCINTANAASIDFRFIEIDGLTSFSTTVDGVNATFSNPVTDSSADVFYNEGDGVTLGSGNYASS